MCEMLLTTPVQNIVTTTAEPEKYKISILPLPPAVSNASDDHKNYGLHNFSNYENL
jgi:hypothetical protein